MAAVAPRGRVTDGAWKQPRRSWHSFVMRFAAGTTASSTPKARAAISSAPLPCHLLDGGSFADQPTAFCLIQ